MRILLTNDDGINSEGLELLKKFVLNLGFKDIWVVAPSGDRSANSHAVTLNKPMYLSKISEKTYILDGTPTDCIIAALKKILKNEKSPDFIFTGINIGANVGIDKIYSGTVAAAMEGLFFGIPSIAFSQLFHSKKETIKWQIENEQLKKIVQQLMINKEIFDNSVLSINLPVNTVKGIKFIEQSKNKMSNIVSHKNDSNSVEQERSEITIQALERPSFCEFLDDGYITITPIGYNLTNYKILKHLNENF